MGSFLLPACLMCVGTCKQRKSNILIICSLKSSLLPFGVLVVFFSSSAEVNSICLCGCHHRLEFPEHLLGPWFHKAEVLPLQWGQRGCAERSPKASKSSWLCLWRFNFLPVLLVFRPWWEGLQYKGGKVEIKTNWWTIPLISTIICMFEGTKLL